MVKQIFIIAYMTGILWLRRNPLSLVFTAISPFSLLFILFIVSNGHYVQFAVAGSLVMALVGYGLSLGQDISLYKLEYKMQDMFVASPVSPLTYMLGLAFSELVYGLPALLVLAISGSLFFNFYFICTTFNCKYFFNLGYNVINRLFFVFSYASYEKCYTANFIC